jgi:hypothetical protein
MKKRLEADLISIAHKILQLKNKSDVNLLFLETQKLYEKLAVLRFVEEHFGEPKPTIGQAEIVEKMKEFFENNTTPEFQRNFGNEKIVAEDIVPEVALAAKIIEDNIAPEEPLKTEIIENEPIIEEEEEVNLALEEVDTIESNATEETLPVFELDEVEYITNEQESTVETASNIEKNAINPIVEQPEAIKAEALQKTATMQISFEDLLGVHYTEPQFVKRSQLEQTSSNKVADEVPPSFNFQPEPISNSNPVVLEKEEPKTITLNDKLANGIAIGLNDRIAFVKHLFDGDSEDYNRVLSQIITFDTFQETKAFIDEMVKPDYNNWAGKEDFEHRFMEIIEKKFLSF